MAYPNIPSSIAPVEHSKEIPIPTLPVNEFSKEEK